MAVGAGGALYLGPLATVFPTGKLRFPEPRPLTQGYLPLSMITAQEETKAAGFLVGSGEEKGGGAPACLDADSLPSWTTGVFCFRNDLKPLDWFQKKSGACHLSGDFLRGHLLKCQERESISWSGTFRAGWELNVFCSGGSQPPPCFSGRLCLAVTGRGAEKEQRCCLPKCQEPALGVAAGYF